MTGRWGGWLTTRRTLRRASKQQSGRAASHESSHPSSVPAKWLGICWRGDCRYHHPVPDCRTILFADNRRLRAIARNYSLRAACRRLRCLFYRLPTSSSHTESRQLSSDGSRPVLGARRSCLLLVALGLQRLRTHAHENTCLVSMTRIHHASVHAFARDSAFSQPATSCFRWAGFMAGWKRRSTCHCFAISLRSFQKLTASPAR